jgi:hypothetical protein
MPIKAFAKIATPCLLSARKLQGKLEALIDYIACTIEPIRRGRSYSRSNSTSKNRIFYCNYKRAK